MRGKIKTCLLPLCLALCLFAPLPGIGAVNKGAVFLIQVRGVINNGTLRYVERALQQAAGGGGKLLLIELDTPGGVLDATRKIVQAIGVSKVPVAVFVAPSGASATSAGTILTMSAHFAGMAPGTNIGAAHPVGGQGEEIKGPMNEKVTNDTVAFIRAQAALRGRNQEWAEQAIRKSVSVTPDEALRLHVVDFIAPDIDGVLQKIEQKAGTALAGLPRVEIPMTMGERFLSFLGQPNVSYLLMVLGGAGLYVEISSPGAVLPGVLGAIALILSFISFSTLQVNTGGLALLALGIVLFLTEAFVPSYGTLTLGAIASLIMGALLLFDRSTGDLRLSLTLVIPTAAAMALFTSIIAYSLLKSRAKPRGSAADFEGYVGVVESVDDTGFSGKCLIRGEVWDIRLARVVANPERALHVGDHVIVADRKGFTLLVEKGN